MKKAMFPIPNELSIKEGGTRCAWLCLNIEVFFNGGKQHRVHTFNVNEGWITWLVTSGYGQYRTKMQGAKKFGKVEVRYKDDVADWQA